MGFPVSTTRWPGREGANLDVTKLQPSWLRKIPEACKYGMSVLVLRELGTEQACTFEGV